MKIKSGNMEAVLGLCVILLLFGGCAAGCVSGGFQYSEGYREGTVQKFSTKGLIWKTHEGQMALQGFKISGGENPSTSNVFDFTVLNEEIVQQITQLHESDHVRLHYVQYILFPPWYGSTGYRIQKVEKVKE